MKKLFLIVLLTLIPSMVWAQDWQHIDRNSLFKRKVKFQGEEFTCEAAVLGASPFIFEGLTEDAFETTLAITDPTADRTITVPDSSGTLMLSGDSSILTSDIVLEGATADDFEMTFSLAADPTADKTITIPDTTGTLLLSTAANISVDVANSATTPSMSITNTETYSITDGTNNLLQVADSGTSGTVTTGAVTATTLAG